jgi:hypothetical protein
MAVRIFYDGFETYSVGTLPVGNFVQDGSRPLASVVTSGVGGVTPRTGTKMLETNNDGTLPNGQSNDNAWTTAVVDPNKIGSPAELFYRVWYFIASDHDNPGGDASTGAKMVRIFTFRNGTYETIGNVRKNITNGAYWSSVVNGVSGTYWGYAAGDNSAVAGIWHKVEYYINHSTGVLKTWQNGILVNSQTGLNFAGVTAKPLYLTSNFSDPHDAQNHIYYDSVEVFADTGAGQATTGLMSDATIQASSGGRVFYSDGTTLTGVRPDTGPGTPRDLPYLVTSAFDGVPMRSGGAWAMNWNGTGYSGNPPAFNAAQIDIGYSNEIFIRFWARIDQDMRVNYPATDTGPKLFRFQNNCVGVWDPYDDEGVAERSYFSFEVAGKGGKYIRIENRHQWHKFEFYFNLSGQTNKIWIDGVYQGIASYTDNVWDTSTLFGFTGPWGLQVSSNWSGGPDNSGNGGTTGLRDHDANNHIYWDDIEIFSDTGTGGTGLMSDATIQQGTPTFQVSSVSSTFAQGSPSTLSGTLFGANTGSAQVTLGGIVQTITSWTDTIIQTTVNRTGLPAGAANYVVRNSAGTNSPAFSVTLPSESTPTTYTSTATLTATTSTLLGYNVALNVKTTAPLTGLGDATFSPDDSNLWDVALWDAGKWGGVQEFITTLLGSGLGELLTNLLQVTHKTTATLTGVGDELASTFNTSATASTLTGTGTLSVPSTLRGILYTTAATLTGVGSQTISADVIYVPPVVIPPPPPSGIKRGGTFGRWFRWRRWRV